MTANSSRDKLLKVAEKLFAEKGYTGVGIRDISAAASLNISAISYYFKNKEGLYKAVFYSKIQHITEILSTAESKALTPQEILKLYADTLKSIHQQNPYFIKILGQEMLFPTNALDEFRNKAVKPLAVLLQQAIKKGCAEGVFISDLSVDKAIMMFVGAINFYYLSLPLNKSVIVQEKGFADSYVDNVLRLFIRGISEVQKDEGL